MKKLGLLAAGSLLLVAFPQMALSKPSVLKIQPEGSQLAAMESGAQVVTSQMAGSIVVMRTPEPFDGKRTRIFFTFVNNGQFPVNVGPENVTSGQVAVVSYDQLIAEQKRSEGVDKFIAALGAVGKTLSATDAGRETTVTSYSGYANCGIGCGGTYSGSAVSRTYSPYAAEQARAQVAAENAAAASEMHSGHASERNAIARNLQTTTVNPGHFLTGMLTFELPSAVRRSKKATPITLAIRIGSDVHMLRGFAGPLGAPPPAVSSAATGQITQPMAGSMVPQTTLIASATTGDAFEENYAYGYRLWEAKSYPQARATLEETLVRFPNHERASYARYLLGRTWFDDRKPATAVKLFYDNYKTDPSGDRAPDSLFFLGCALTELGKTAEAREAFVELKRAYKAEASGRLAPLLNGGCERRGLSKIAEPFVSNTVPPTAPANNEPRMLNAADLIKSSDYPAGSMSRGEVGISGYELTLNNGRPVSCKITSSSGFEELDKATCRLATERSVFDMSTLPKGNWSTYSNRVRWNIIATEPRAYDSNLTATQSVSRADPNRIRCQYSDGVVSFVNAGNPCIQAATASNQPLASNTVPPTVPANSQAQILNAGDLVNGSDYPSGSLSRGEEGIAAFKLTLKNGRPASCKIISSSGFEELDEATCRLATERAVFDMSTLPKGDWSTYSNRVRWILSASAPRANSVNLTASQSVSRVDPNKIRCQYSDGVVSFVNAGNPCIQAATLPTQQVNADLMATISKAILEGRCEDAKTVALTASRLDLADQAMRLCKTATKQSTVLKPAAAKGQQRQPVAVRTNANNVTPSSTRMKNSATAPSGLLSSEPIGQGQTMCFYENQRRLTVAAGRTCPFSHPFR